MALNVIQEYISNLEEPIMNLPAAYLSQSSYSLWAANEIFVYVLAHNELTPIEAVDAFVRQMDDYRKGRCEDKNKIFNIAYDVAREIHNILVAMV